MVAILQIKLSYQKHKTLPKNYNNIFSNQQTIKNFEIKVTKTDGEMVLKIFFSHTTIIV
jgi:hypothetical protein